MPANWMSSLQEASAKSIKRERSATSRPVAKSRVIDSADSVSIIRCADKQRAPPSRRTSDDILRDRRGFDAIELGEVFIEIRLAQRGDRALVRRLAVAAVNLLHHVHAGNHLAKWREAHFIQLRVVSGVDEKLRGARVLARGRKSDVAGLVALCDGIVLEIRFAPHIVYRRVSAQSELH